MKASTSFVLRTLVVAGLSVGLGLAFNASRPDSLPLAETRTAPAPVAPQVSPAPAPTSPAADGAAPAENASTAQPAPAEATQDSGGASPADGAQTKPADEGNSTRNLAPAGDAAASPAESGQAAPAPAGWEISLQDAAVLSAAGQAVMVDARDAQTYAEGHIQGALSLPLFSFEQDFPALKDSLAGKTVITYCDGERCSLSSELAESLRARGVENVYELRNGWTLWRDQGLPTATGSNPETGGGRS